MSLRHELGEAEGKMGFMCCRGKEEVITIRSGGVGYLDVECLAYTDGLLKNFALLSVSTDPTVLIFSIVLISSTPCQQNKLESHSISEVK